MAKKQTIDLPPPQNKILQKILRQHIPNKTVWAFGSRVEWKASETSDLDLVAHKCSGAEIADLKEALEESALHCSVDVLNWEDIPDSFRANIKKHYVVVQQNTVPERWRVVKLGNIAHLVKNTWRVGDEKLPYVGLEHIDENGLRLNSVGISDSISSNKFRFAVGDTLFGKLRPYFRKVIKPKFEGICSMDIWVVRPKENVNKDYLFYFFANQELVDIASSSSMGTRMPRADWDFLSETTWKLPPLPEQKAIAEVLSSLDDHIDILGQVIEKKRMIRQGMMQQLLTRKIRLPGFSGEWSLKKIKDIGILYSGLIGKTKSDFGSGSYYITFLNVIENTVINHGKLGQVIVKLNENQNIVQKEDLIFNASSETPNEIGMCAAVINLPKENVYLNSFCFGFRPRDNTKSDSLYLAYYFRSDEGRKLLKFLSQGSTRYNLSKKAFLDISVALSPIAEQAAIAAVLSDIDAEIAALEAKKTKAMQIKQGAMQQLLTGKIRLTVDTAQKIADII